MSARFYFTRWFCVTGSLIDGGVADPARRGRNGPDRLTRPPGQRLCWEKNCQMVSVASSAFEGSGRPRRSKMGPRTPPGH